MILKKDHGWQRLILIQCHVEVHLSIISKYVILNHIDWGLICLIYFISFLHLLEFFSYFNENSRWPNHAKVSMTSIERFLKSLRDHSSITPSMRWVGGVRKWQFLIIYSTINHQRCGWVAQKNQKHVDVILEWSL